jgi:hypothetical protein
VTVKLTSNSFLSNGSAAPASSTLDIRPPSRVLDGKLNHLRRDVASHEPPGTRGCNLKQIRPRPATHFEHCFAAKRNAPEHPIEKRLSLVSEERRVVSGQERTAGPPAYLFSDR